jgi:cytoskeleton protein RodZ
MSEVVEVAAPVAGISAGTLLRRAREAAGLHVAALAVSLKVPVRKLEALEEDRYDDIGDAVFIRALASSVCRTLKIDPQPVLGGLPQSAVPRLTSGNEGLNAPFRASSDSSPPAWREALRQPVPLTVMALLLGAVVIYLLPNLQSLQSQEDKNRPAAVTAVVPVPAPMVAAVVPAPEPAAATASEPAPARVAVAPPAATPAPVPDAPSAAAPAPANGIVVIRAKGESWIEVVDAKGAAALRKLMAAGETAGASGALPLTVTIGRVDMTEVEVRGKKFDMRPVSKDNVARFQVK